LEADGFITRFESPTSRPQVEYELTTLGRSLSRSLQPLERWAARNHDLLTASRRSFDRRQSGEASRRDAEALAVPMRPAGTGEEPTIDRRAPAFEDLKTESVTVVVRNIERSAAAYARALGVGVSGIVEKTVALPDGGTAQIKLCSVQFTNFRIALAQHVSGPTPHKEFIARVGEGVHHVGFVTSGHLEEKVALLQKKGGRLRLGGPTAPYASVDFREQLGTDLGIATRAHLAKKVAHLHLGSDPCVHVEKPDHCVGSRRAKEVARPMLRRLTHIGVVVPDIEETARMYGEVLGVASSPIKVVKFVAPGRARADCGIAKIASLRTRGVVLKLIEPVGPGPLRDFVERHGSGVHHLGFEVGEKLPHFIEELGRSGGKRVLGGSGCGYAHIDLTSQLGLVLELSGVPA
jgi:methylmalonyl-CoA/ethylmalonyl-CoA epimerase